MNKLNITAPPGSHEITLAREFDAPRDLVFKTMTDPKKTAPHFWGPRSLTTTVDKMDARSGGSWRFVQTDPNGEEYGFHGVYHDVTPSERIIRTFEWEGSNDQRTLKAFVQENGSWRQFMTTHYRRVE